MAFLLYLLGGLILRFWDFQHTLYFIYDQGRDAIVLQKILQGDFVLVGPTTGLPGLFLGPLWYYVGVVGSLVSGGNPYGICLWYMAVSSLALPLFWWLARRLFPEKFWAAACALLLAIIPGSIGATLMIWNPLLSVPLMMTALFAFDRVIRHTAAEEVASPRLFSAARRWLAAAYFLLALVLQSEFAYAVFLLPTALTMLPWLRSWWRPGKGTWKFQLQHLLSPFIDIVIVGSAISVTLVPQALFEVRNHFLMTSSLWRSMHDASQSISWAELFAQRPLQLLQASIEITLGGGVHTALLIPLLLICFAIGIVALWQSPNDPRRQSAPSNAAAISFQNVFVIFALIPYLGYLFWRGNHGYFFPYYITPHFVFLIPLALAGLQWVAHQLHRRHYPEISWGVVLGVILLIIVESMRSWWLIVGHSTSQAGLSKMLDATDQLIEWVRTDQQLQPGQTPVTPIFRTYTSNVYTENYDYLYGWKTKQLRWPEPITVNTPTAPVAYLLIEHRDAAAKVFFQPWYYEATKGRHLIHSSQVGILTLEAWAKD